MMSRGALRTFILALVAAAIVTLGISALASPSHTITAEFANASGLVAGNDVRVHGVVAGSVKSVAISTDPATGTQFAVAVVGIDDAYWPLHAGTHLAVKPKGVLANVYVDVEPGGTSGRALPAGYTFAVTQTTSPVNLDALTNVFTPSVRDSIRTQIQQGVVAFGGGGAQGLATTLDNTDPLLRAAVPTTDVLAADSPQLDRLNAEFDAVSGMLAREDAHLRTLITSADTTVAAIAGQAGHAQGTLAGAAQSLSDIDATLTGEESNLQAIFQRGPQALALLQQNAQALSPLIAAVNPHITSLDQLLTEFVTATGFTQGTPGGIDTLRIDGSLPPSSRGSAACGGEPAQQSC